MDLKKSSFQSITMYSSAAFLLTMTVCGILGLYFNYSPIPYWDMWDSTLAFFMRVESGDYSAWWDQHNEHRIVLSKVLFWIDYAFFNGVSIFLISFNFVLACVSSFFFYLFLASITNPLGLSKNNQKTILFLLVSWLFLWTQHENFIWGFQSQFFLAQLLPLSALYFLAASVGSKNILQFTLAIVAGLLSLLSMANGLIVMPMLFVLSLFLPKVSVTRKVILLILAVLLPAVYLTDYVSPAGHGSVVDTLLTKPVQMMEFIFIYMGNPFFYLFGKGKVSGYIAGFMGIVFLTLFFLVAYKSLWRQRKTTSVYITALLFFILYVLASSVAVAGARLIFGLEAAVSGRYTTPTIWAWAALAIVLLDFFKVNSIRFNGILSITIFSFVCLLLLQQFSVFKNVKDKYANREVAGLALAMSVDDDEFITKVYPSTIRALDIAKAAREQGISFMSIYPYNKTIGKVGSHFEQHASVSCHGEVNVAEVINSNSIYVRVRGWIHNPASDNRDKLINIMNAENVIVGFALTGDLGGVGSLNKNVPQDAYFVGYMLKEAINEPVKFVGDQQHCFFTSTVDYVVSPDQLENKFFNIHSVSDDCKSRLMTGNVISNSGFDGSDYYHSDVAEGYRVFGSFVRSDSDIGSIKLKFKNGDAFYYRSGPTYGNQILIIDGNKVILPVTKKWQLFKVTSKTDQEIFEVEIVDKGKRWGEWSAIALLEKGKLGNEEK